MASKSAMATVDPVATMTAEIERRIGATHCGNARRADVDDAREALRRINTAAEVA